MKKVVYTAIIKDGADKSLSVTEPKKVTKGWDYVAFVDDPNLTSKRWNLVHVDRDMSINSRKQARKYKILNDKYFSDYDISVWIDSRFKINCDLDKLVKTYLTSDYDIAMMRSPKRQCIFKELIYCKAHTQCSKKALMKQHDRYKKEGVPSDLGLLRTGLIMRKHNIPNQTAFMEEWFEEIINESERDTPSFAYALWKRPLRLNIMPTKKIYNMFRR